MGQQRPIKVKKGQPGAKARKLPSKKVPATETVQNPLSFTPLLLDIDQLKPHPRNYRVHPPDQIAHLKQSITEHGFYRNVVVANDYTLLAGHGSWRAAIELGFKQIPVIVLNIPPDDPRAIKVLVGDNEIEHLASQDDRLLTTLLREINTADQTELLGTGYDAMMLAALVYVTRPAHEINSFDAAAEWAGMPDYNASTQRFQLNIKCQDAATRTRLLQLIKIAIDPTWETKEIISIYWPDNTKRDIQSLVFRQKDSEHDNGQLSGDAVQSTPERANGGTESGGL